MVSDMNPDFQVHQSTESSSDFLFEIGERDIRLTFLSSTKGRMEFSAEIDDEPQGKVNVLSQHSIARMAKAVCDDKDEIEDFKQTFLKAGVILRMSWLL